MYDILGALAANFDEVHYMDFYRDVFPEGSFEERGVFEDGKYNGIAVAIEKGSKRAKRMTITDDLDVIGAFNVLLHACTVAPNAVTAFNILCHRSHVRPFTRPKSDFFV